MVRHCVQLISSLCLAAGLIAGGAGLAAAQVAPRLTSTTKPEATLTEISITVGDNVIRATLRDNPTARDFVTLLPLTLTMQRWGEREYYGKPARGLASQGNRQNSFANGDVAYWVPGGSFAIFFDQGTDSSISDLIVLGNVVTDLSVLRNLGRSVDMRIELAGKN